MLYGDQYAIFGSQRHLEFVVFIILFAQLKNLPIGNSIVSTIVFALPGKVML